MNNIQKSKRLNDGSFVSYIGLFLIGFFCFSYSIFVRQFAELHIKLGFLDFPIFIGEILIIICLILLVRLWIAKPVKINKWHYLMFFYISWFLIKAFYGYFSMGPLSFRNAALFYYPVFVIFGFYFFSSARGFFSQRIIISLLFIMGTALLTHLFDRYYLITFMMLFIILVKNISKKRIRNIAIAITALILILRYPSFFKGSRTHLVGLSATFLFLIIYFFFLIKGFKKRYVFIALTIILSVVCMSILKYSDRSGLKSLVSPDKIVSEFKTHDSIIEEDGENFQPFDLKVKLYNDEKVRLHPSLGSRLSEIVPINYFKGRFSSGEQIAMSKVIVTEIEKYADDLILESQQKLLTRSEEFMKILLKWAEEDNSVDFVRLHDLISKRTKSLVDEVEFGVSKTRSEISRESRAIIVPRSKPEGRSLSIARVNVLFRLFIWRDMLEELWENKIALFFGFNFGYPQRSRSLEILGWADGEWRRDGWITPHNSYLHMFYRGGIVGVVFMLSIAFVILKMIRDFLRMRSLEGGLLISILVYWLVMSIFLVMMELPYNAIPLWSLFGITLAYCQNLRKSRKRKDFCSV